MQNKHLLILHYTKLCTVICCVNRCIEVKDLLFTVHHINFHHCEQARRKNTEDRKEQESVARELIRIELVCHYDVCIYTYTLAFIKEAQRAYDKDVLEQQLSSSITDPEVKKSLAKVQQKAYKNFSDSATVSSKPQVTTEQSKSGKRSNNANLAAKAKAAFQESYNQRQMKPPAENKLLWWQLVTPEGHPYYYNTVTGGEC